MKKIILYTITCLIASIGYAQIQNINAIATPDVITADTEITITFSNLNPNLWNANVTNDAFLWAWYFDSSGAFGGNSPTNGEWTNSNDAQQLTNNGDGTYSFTLTPSQFYGTSNISRLGMLVKAKDGSDSGNGEKKTNDIFFELSINTLTLNTPSTPLTVVESGTAVSITATTTFTSNFTLTANGVAIHTAQDTTNYSFNYTITENTNFTLEANDGTLTLSENFSIRLPSQTPVPDGMLDGINLDPNDPTKATLVLYAPGKLTAHVIGDFNNWQENPNYLMFLDTSQDRFWIELTGLTPGENHMYQYLVDSTIRVADPYSPTIIAESNDQFIDNVTYPNLPSYPTGSTNFAVTLLRTGDAPYEWQITDFEKPAKTDLVIYELLIRDFDELHSFDAVRARLDYLQNLGINAIEFMPLNEFDGNLSWGYNPSFHMGLDKYYGTANAFKQLVDACHERGIAVIVDVVYNHASGQHPCYRLWNTDNGGFVGQAREDNPFFNPSAKHSFSVFNDLNHQSQATQDYVKRTIDFWITEYNIDGFRWDLTKGFTQNCSESDSDCTNGLQQDRVDVLKTYADYQWALDPDFYVIFEHLGILAEEKQWADYRADEGKGIMLWSKLTTDYTGLLNGNRDISGTSYRVRGFDGPSAISYMESHDEERLVFNANNTEDALEKLQTAGAFFFTVPGPKMIWQFGELGYDVSIDFNGRTGEKPIRWEYFDVPSRRALYDSWSELIQLRLDEPVFATTNFDIQLASAGKTVHLTNDNPTEDAIEYITVIGNFGNTALDIDPQFQTTGTWYDVLQNNTPLNVTTSNQTITLQPGEYHIYGNKPYINPNDTDSDGVFNSNDLCNDTPLGATVDVNGCEIFTLPNTNFALQVTDETCRNSNNGSISITAAQDLAYTVTITGGNNPIEDIFNSTYTATALDAGNYEVCITLANQPDFSQCFNVAIEQPAPLSVTSKTALEQNSFTAEMQGSNTYYITHNGTTITTTKNHIELQLKAGLNTISIKGEQDCQGHFEERVFQGTLIRAFPNPISHTLNVMLGSNGDEKQIQIYSLLGKRVYNTTTTNSALSINTSKLNSGSYILRVSTTETTKNIKLIKQ